MAENPQCRASVRLTRLLSALLVSPMLWLAPEYLPGQGSASTEVRVPKASAPTIDGRLVPGEWDGSYEAALSDGSRLWLRHDGEFLFLAVRSASLGFSSLCVLARDTVRVVHASAALGTGIFTRAGDDWLLRQQFAFALRSGDISESGKAAQRAYLISNRWVASNSAMSQTEREMQVALSLFDPADRRMALGYFILADASVARWPVNVDDGCTASRVVQGPLPTEPIRMERERWALVRLIP